MDHRAHERGGGMLNTPYVKKDTIKNFFPVPNAAFDLGLYHMEKAAQALERQRAQANAERLGIQFVPADDEQGA